MTILEFVINKDKEMYDLKYRASEEGITIEHFILQEYCPSYFKSLFGTLFFVPYQPSRTAPNICEFSEGTRNYGKCIKCWNRTV